MESDMPLDVPAHDNSALLQVSIGELVKFPRLVGEPEPGQFSTSGEHDGSPAPDHQISFDAPDTPPAWSRNRDPVVRPPHESLVLESESRNVYHPDACTAVCICVVKRRKSKHGLGSTPTLQHPYLVRQFAITENYIITEHCSLGNIRDYLLQPRIVPVVAWATQLCSSLSYLHSKGLARTVIWSRKVCWWLKEGQGVEEISKDVRALGDLLWFIESGGKAVPNRVTLVDVQGLKLGDPILRCWADDDGRPSLNELLVVLESLDKDIPSLPFQSPAEQPSHGHPGTPSARLGAVKLALSDYGIHKGLENERAFIVQVRPVHPNIVRYLVVTNDLLFMEYHPNGSLEDYLKPDVPPPPVLKWSTQLCSALVYLHDLGYAHNQVYPCNVLVASGPGGDGYVLKLCDFETATLAEDFIGGTCRNAPEVERAQSGCTNSDDPEIRSIRGDLSDVYCLGLIIWFIQNKGEEPPDNRTLEYEEGCNWECYYRVLAACSHNDIIDVDGLFLGDVMRMCWAPQTDRPTSREVMRHLLEVNEGGS